MSRLQQRIDRPEIDVGLEEPPMMKLQSSFLVTQTGVTSSRELDDLTINTGFLLGLVS